MFKPVLRCSRLLLFIKKQTCFSVKASPTTTKRTIVQNDPEYIRNIGILAHIDAGKTTTTERMLFYSGKIHHMGEVHHGNTVTDFMEQERERGITITSASVTFPWGNHSFNLIDTPGHIDFTMEVEQTLNVLDGSIVVLDASAGVEAQTLTVWRQANNYHLPRIIYINKMDRPDAGYFSSINSVSQKLHTATLPLQLPYVQDKKFKGIIDILKLELMKWDPKSHGVNVSRHSLTEADGKLWEEAIACRLKLTETLADLDDSLAEYIIQENKNLENVPKDRLSDSIRKSTLELRGVPVVCGSSYKNIGVQALMDSVIQYLPSPLSKRTSPYMKISKDTLCARAFKVRHDSHKGPITFFRVYSGQIKKGQKLYNIRQERSEQMGKLLIAAADDYEEIDSIGIGNIAAVAGLKSTVTGDLITSSGSAASSLKKILEEYTKLNVFIPDPVFFCSIECSSQAYQAALDRALAELSREDPSFRVSQNTETGQTVLSGMGELHLDVIRERIRSEYKVDVELGPLQIAYKEAVITSAKDSHVVHLKLGNSQHSVNITMSVAPCEKATEVLHLDRSQDSAANIAAIFPKNLLAVKNGVDSALSRGPKLSFPVINAKVTLHWLEVGRGTSESVITSAASQCVRKILGAAGTKLLEPVMSLEVVCNEEAMSRVTADLNRRRVNIESITMRGHDKILKALVPLSELLGYSTHLRTTTSGQASFSMEFHSLQEMSPADEAKAIKNVTGLDPL